MPADNIKRAIMRGTGELEGGQIDEIMFEGYGPGGAAVLVTVATDNRNRTVSEIRHCSRKTAATWASRAASPGCSSARARSSSRRRHAGEDKLMDVALEAGADDLRDDGDMWAVLSAPDAHEAVSEAIRKAGIPMVEAAIAMVPKNLIRLEGKIAQGMLKLNDALEDQDDVQNVYSNFDIDEKELEAMA